jgi:hypothetical protein
VIDTYTCGHFTIPFGLVISQPTGEGSPGEGRKMKVDHNLSNSYHCLVVGLNPPHFWRVTRTSSGWTKSGMPGKEAACKWAFGNKVTDTVKDWC